MSSPATPPTNPQRGPRYETRDVNPKVILGLIGSIAIVMAVSMFGLRFLLTSHEQSASRNVPPHLQRIDQTPPAPRLQNTPIRDYQVFVAEQEEQLNSYGWVDREKGIVRVPVERAMDLALKNGLPKPAPPNDSAASITETPEPKQE